ncbi:hypothetical protein SAMN04487948_10644 [Halogranum amylolyticum]|uniref:Uncharacterized protein n=1 Tax=Halogranum amylolyticum TaxID=660520 RepID=A0A1H8T5Y7_9EURY|nr:hypothetical protein [Halogranum amylolyticum]SEO86529.1 hypothetical protein SAMN04487948_10644 [Halogranum amylolyticum]
MARDDKYSSTGSDADYSSSPFKNADSPAVSERTKESDEVPDQQPSTTEGDSTEPPTDSDLAGEDSNTETADASSLDVITRDGLPYAMARSKVTDDRQQKQFQLLKETRFELQDAVADLVKQYDEENLSETDALEIILRTGLAHAEDYDEAAKSLGFGLENVQFTFSE